MIRALCVIRNRDLHRFTLQKQLFDTRYQDRLMQKTTKDMKYSPYNFVDLDIAHKISDDDCPYKLFQFTDRTDTCWEHLREGHKKGSDHHGGGAETERWCQHHSSSAAVCHPVVYMPGHYGSYIQSISLGTHRIQLPGKTTASHTRAGVQV